MSKSAIEAYEAENVPCGSEAGTIEQIKISDSGEHLIFQNPVRERLQIFLQSSDLYDPEEVLDLIEGSELWLEKVC